MSRANAQTEKLNCKNLNFISYRMQQAVPAPSLGMGRALARNEALAEAMKNHLVLVGDHLQVRK